MQPLSILSVKIGSKYNSEMVNNLYIMCCKNITTPFKFFCYTDDPTGLLPEIKIIKFVDHNFEVVFYNKLVMFSPWFDQQLLPGKRLYFDIDLIIKFNIDDVIDSATGDLTLIDAVWREKFPPGFPIWHHPFNSSCMVWETSPKTISIWDHLMCDPEMFMCKYYWGMDSFLYYEKEKIGIDVGYFPIRKFYSHMYGVDFSENVIHEPITMAYRPSKFIDVVKNIPIVLLNGPTTRDQYEQYKQYYAV